jgi:hypothetical protein
MGSRYGSEQGKVSCAKEDVLEEVGVRRKYDEKQRGIPQQKRALKKLEGGNPWRRKRSQLSKSPSLARERR